ncbi:MAG: FAD-dependent oxidoreductase [Candidatus Omnitrophota bacterium]|jgi:NAD(P)H-nitrite reductase large subunit
MMNHIVIIGASAFGHNVAFKIRERNKGCKITLISEEGYLAYDHLRLADFISGTISEKDVFLCNEDDYSRQGINFLKNKKVASINIQRRLLYFKDKGNINYDILIIASGRSPTILDIPGARKEGAYRLYTLDDAKEFLKRYIAFPVCIVGSSSFALKIAEVVSEKYGVETKILSSAAFNLADLPPKSEVINDTLAEVIGEGEVQAVKLASGKVLGVSAVLFMDNYKANIDFLKNTDIQIKEDYIAVNGLMATNYDNIFACGSVVGRDSLAVSLMLADNITNRLGQEDAGNISAVK